MVRNRQSRAAVVANNHQVMMDEESRRKCDTIIEDFDKQVEKRIQDMRANYEACIAKVQNLNMVMKIRLPKEIRQMKASDFYKALTSDGKKDEVVVVVEEESKVLLPPPTTTTTTTTKTTARKRSRKPVARAETMTTAVRRSTRKRTVPRSMLKTPSVLSLPEGLLATPFALPTKFNINTPLNRSVCRLARPNETLVSLTGSPVYVPGGEEQIVKKNNSNVISVTLRDGKTVQIPSKVPNDDVSGDVDLDESAKEKLLMIRSQINGILKIKENN